MFFYIYICFYISSYIWKNIYKYKYFYKYIKKKKNKTNIINSDKIIYYLHKINTTLTEYLLLKYIYILKYIRTII